MQTFDQTPPRCSCGRMGWPKKEAAGYFCPGCGAPVDLMEHRRSLLRLKPTPEAPIKQKRYVLTNRKGEFLASFYDEQSARERMATLSFNGVYAKLTDKGEQNA